MTFIALEAWRPAGVDDLEPAAWEALRHPGSTSVVAGPGAGKTEFLAQRATFLLQTGACPPPYRILAISFKRDAAENLSARVRDRCPADQAGRFNSMTFDAFTKGLVDRFSPALPPVWRPSKPYAVVFPRDRDLRDALDRARLSARPEWQNDIAGIAPSLFESRYLGTYRLPTDPIEPHSGATFAVHRWWTENLRRPGRSHLTFVMLNRLAELLVRIRAPIRRPLQITYPFLFIDEFQDTTYAQYDFLLSAFGGSATVVTAVGDDKQRIMVWAGARVDAFARFEGDFHARRIPLLLNFRSSPDLVRIQHVVARALDAGVIESGARAERSIDGAVAQIWNFRTEASEARQIAEWLAQDIRSRHTQPRDYALLVRQTADRFEAQLSAAMQAVGLKIRNESRKVGRTTLQDLLVETLTKIGVSLMRLAAQRRAPEAWMIASEAILRLRNADLDDDVACQNAERSLSECLARVRTRMSELAPNAESARELANEVMSFLDLTALSRTFIEYATGDALSIAAEAFCLHFAASATNAADWTDCMDMFEGINQVPLMTVHKSKGLEYDSILFVGLDDRMWWSHVAGNPEGISTFFVALSRAKQRAIFTFCEARGRRDGVADLYQLLADAGVPELTF
jgi:superfamily I DNA/RNA helicase